jgi:hypothetical protein
MREGFGMQLSAVLLARVLLFIESLDLNPQGKTYYPDLVEGIVEKCRFMKFPQKLEDFDESKGVEFVGGRWGDVTIEAFKIFNNGLQLDTRVSTSESERVLREALAWASSNYGIIYHPKMVARRLYVSNLTFHTDVPILGTADSPVSRLAHRAQVAMAEMRGDDTRWAPTILTMNSDIWPRKPLHAPFTIQRRAEAAFGENKYYSEAPLPTDFHISLLEEFEKDVQKG